jgi:hypothetical protein
MSKENLTVSNEEYNAWLHDEVFIDNEVDSSTRDTVAFKNLVKKTLSEHDNIKQK